ncbi:MAG TPA: aldehyde ferredoxin oxidoreductase family protein [Anaerolineales bacterium]|nr:aldehyde ferredoxin oxidoreductase family protein [Anaerolineales bacterium]
MQPILKIDLSTGYTEEYRIPEKWEKDFLGGASLAARILYSSLTRELDALSPEAPLLFMMGPLTGTSGPTTGRFVICGKGPATGLWAESNIGGFWGPELRAAGYDGLWITGKASEPVYLWLNGSRLAVRNAAHLWGRNTYTTQDKVKEEVGEKSARVCVIGPAGERQVLFASIMCDHGRMAGRTGLGAVMGSKNLKAIAVRGTNEIPVFDLARYKALRSESNRKLRDDNEARVLREIGTAGAANYSEYLGAMPAKYYSSGVFPAVDDISGAKMTEAILVGRSACQGCVIACGRVVKLPKDVLKRKGPEHETMAGFGANLLNGNLESIVDLGELCDRYGMDTISASNTIGLAFRLFDKGIITGKDTGGMVLRWGDVDVIEQLVRLTGSREGIGDLLAKGSRQFGAHFGAEEEAVQVNGLEIAYHDPRGVSGMAISYATSPRGACHNQSDYFFVDWGHSQAEIGIEFFSRHAQAEKAAGVARHQDWRSVDNAVVMCIFANVEPKEKAALINAACGLEWTVEDMMKFGERSWNLKRAINNRMGLTRANDKLPKALLEPFPDGGSAGFVPDLEGMLTAYYQHRGWDVETGKPSWEKLVELGLRDVATDLWGMASE